MDAVDADAREAIEVLRTAGHSRAPLCNDLDDVAGVVHLKDLAGASTPGSDGGLRARLDAELGAVGNEEVHEVGVEALQRARAAVDDYRSCTGACGDVRELERHEAAADERIRRGSSSMSRKPVLSIKRPYPGKCMGRGRAPVAMR